MEQGWIAGYPPWFHQSLIRPTGCKTEGESSRLLRLLRSIEDGKPDDTRQLLEGIDPNLRLAAEVDGSESLLELAAEKASHDDCIRALLEKGASIKAPNLVLNLVAYRKQTLLEEVLAAGADPNSGPSEETRLVTACWDNARAARMLLEAGERMDVTTTVYVTNRKGIKRVSPLMVAAYAGEEQIVSSC
jgi:hypothetical protein